MQAYAACIAYNNEFGIWIIHSFLALHVIKLMMFDNMTIDHCNSKEYFEFSHKLRKGSRNSDNFLAQSSIIPAKDKSWKAKYTLFQEEVPRVDSTAMVRLRHRPFVVGQIISKLRRHRYAFILRKCTKLLLLVFLRVETGTLAAKACLSPRLTASASFLNEAAATAGSTPVSQTRN